MDLGLRLTHVVEARVKHVLGCPRPSTFSPLVQPMIDTPPHGTLPSGHATEAFMLASLLSHVAGEDPMTALADHAPRFRLAARIAINRTVAGVHFPVDSAAGAVLGLALADHLAARAGLDVPVTPLRFDAGGWADRDFHLGEMARALGADGLVASTGDPLVPPAEPGLAWLMAKAQADWSARWD